MTIKHDELVKSLCKSGTQICDEMNQKNAHLMHMVFGVSGEAGELLDAIKKHIIYQKPLDIDNVIEELGDIEFYLEGLRQGLNLSREQTLESNISKLKTRYSTLKYRDIDAHNRADKKNDP